MSSPAAENSYLRRWSVPTQLGIKADWRWWITVPAAGATSKVPKYALKPVSISRISSADDDAIAAAAPRFDTPPTERRLGFINCTNTRPASSYNSLPNGVLPHGYETTPVAWSFD